MDTSHDPSTRVIPASVASDEASPEYGPIRRWILLTTAIVQFISPTFFQFSGSATDPPITPPGVFFSIWGLITTGCLAVALWGFPTRRAAVAPYRHVQLPLSITQILFACWLAAATSPGDRYRFLTLPIFMGMLAGVSAALAAVQRTANDGGDALTSHLLSGVLGLYAGWSTPAIWLNLGALLPTGLLMGANGTALQAGLVGAAVVSVIGGNYLSNSNVGYSLASAWALTGVLISSVKTELMPVAVTAGIGLAVLVSRLVGVVRFHMGA